MTINIHTFRSPMRFGSGFIYDYAPKGRVTGFYLRVWHRELWVEWDVTPQLNQFYARILDGPLENIREVNLPLRALPCTVAGMENKTCGALSCPNPGYAYRCDSEKGHTGSHFDSRYYENWPRKITDTAEFRAAHSLYAPWFNAEYKTGVLGQWTDPRYKAKVTGEFHGDFCLQFTAHELAELYVILSGNHDIPEVYLNKVAAALKEAL